MLTALKGCFRLLALIQKHYPAPRLRQLAHAVPVAVLALAAAPLDAVIVTGARGTGRTVANSAAPIDVISAQQLQAMGKLNLLDVLETALPSFNLPARVQPDLGSIVRAGQLRNLDPSHTLVLVNGKRRHTTAIVNEDGFPGSAATDLALIPTGPLPAWMTYPGGKTDFDIGNQRYSRSTTNADARRSVPLGLSEPADLSVGLEYLHETQQRSPGEPASRQGSGSSALAGYLPVDASDTARHSYAAYIGLGTKLTPQWLLDTALRAEKYLDFGSKTTGRLSARYDATATAAVRGTVSNGFHAPSLVRRSYSNTSDHAGVPYTLAQPNSAAARALGAQALKPEKSTNLSAGLSVNPTPALRLALDAYQIKVSDRLGVSSNIGIDRSSGVALDGSCRPLSAAQANVIENLPRSAGLAVGNGLVAHYFANVGDTRTRGVDFTAEDVLRVAKGKQRWTVAANLNHTSLVGKAAPPAVLQGLPNIGTLGKSAEYDLLCRATRDKEIVTLAYEKAGWTFNRVPTICITRCG